MSACDWVDWCSQNHSSGNVAVEKRTDYPTEIIDVSVHNNTNDVPHRQEISYLQNILGNRSHHVASLFSERAFAIVNLCRQRDSRVIEKIPYDVRDGIDRRRR